MFRKNSKDKNQNLNLKYSNWEELFQEAWVKTYSSKEEYFDERFIRSLEDKVINNKNLSDQEKMSVIYKTFENWKNWFDDIKIPILEPVIEATKTLIDNENLNWLFKNKSDLSWFITNKTENGQVEIDLSHYEEPFDFDWLKILLNKENQIKYCIDNQETKFNTWTLDHYEKEFLTNSKNEIQVNEFYIPYCGDERFYMMGPKNIFIEYENDWNESIDEAIEEVKEMYQENKHLLSTSNSSDSLT